MIFFLPDVEQWIGQIILWLLIFSSIWCSIYFSQIKNICHKSFYFVLKCLAVFKFNFCLSFTWYNVYLLVFDTYKKIIFRLNESLFYLSRLFSLVDINCETRPIFACCLELNCSYICVHIFMLITRGQMLFLITYSNLCSVFKLVFTERVISLCLSVIFHLS